MRPPVARGIALAAAMGLSILTGACREEVPPAGAPPGEPLKVSINARSWRVELATTVAQRWKGLSGRPELAPDAGMLFVYPVPDVLQFCMRDCYVDLDIAFLGPDLRVVATHRMAAEPDRAGRARYSSGVPAQYALEVRAGALADADVRVGDRAFFSGGVPQAAKAEPDP